jgi:hypothetical protein
MAAGRYAVKHEQEQLRLVTDFGKLKAGDLVVAKPCGWCTDGAHGHRVMLMSPARVFVNGADQDVFHSAPAPHGWGDFVVSRGNVDKGLVYLVDTGLTQEQETTEAAPARRPVGVRL